MTYSDLIAALKEILDPVYEMEAPKGATRFVVHSRYGASTVVADDAVQMELPKVQLDICWQNLSDTLPDDVKAKLSALYIPYSVQERYYDDDYMAMREILQCEVL